MSRFVFLIGILLLSLSVNAQKTLIVNAVGICKVYDRQTWANVTLEIINLEPGVDVEAHYDIANFDTWDVGPNKPILVEGIYLTGDDAGDYSYNTEAITEACITPRPIVGEFSVADKYFDQTTDATITDRFLIGVLTGDEDGIEIFGGVASFTDPNVGDEKPVNQRDMMIQGYRAFNYRLDTVYSTTAEIYPLQITARFSAEDKIYDKTITATIDERWIDGLIGLDTASISLIGGNAVFDNWHAGEDKFVYSDSTMQVIGNDLGNYEVIIIYTTKATIFPKPVNIIAAQDIKLYNQTTDSDEAPNIEPDMLPGDTGYFWQVYDTRFAGAGKTMYPFGEIEDGNGGNNYIITFVLNYEGIITPLYLKPNFLAADKVYDGNTDAVMTVKWADGVLNGENVLLVGGTAEFETPWVGSDKLVTGSGLSIIGADARNYVCDSVVVGKADITPLLLTTQVYSDKPVYHSLEEVVTLTAVVEGGGPLMEGGPWAAIYSIFSVDGFDVSDETGNIEIDLQIDKATNDLIASISAPLSSMAVDGNMEYGVKDFKAGFYDEDRNYIVSPNPAISKLIYIPDQEFMIYPNPNSGSFNIEYTPQDEGPVTLSLFDGNGKVLLDKEYSSNNGHISDFINLSSHPADIYYIRINDRQNVFFKKVVVW